MRKITKIIPLFGLIFSVVSCQSKTPTSDNTQDTSITEPGETSEEKALREATLSFKDTSLNNSSFPFEPSFTTIILKPV